MALIKHIFFSPPFLLYVSTVPLPPPASVQFPMVTHSMLRVSWVPGAVDVPGHRITYSTNHGSDVKQVTSQTHKFTNVKVVWCTSTPHQDKKAFYGFSPFVSMYSQVGFTWSLIIWIWTKLKNTVNACGTSGYSAPQWSYSRTNIGMKIIKLCALLAKLSAWFYFEFFK